MKKITLLLVAVLLLTPLAACGQKETPVVSPSVTEVVEALKTEDQFPMLMEATTEQVQTYTGLDLSLIAEGQYFEPFANVQGNLLYVAKVKDTKDIEAVKAGFQKRLEEMQRVFSTYLPNVYELTLKGQVVSKGDIVLLVIANDSAKAVETFEGLFK